MSGQDDSNQDGNGGDKNSKDKNLFEPKPKPKMIRVLTVLAYVLSVSMAAILLSIYYIFMWDGRPHLGARIGDIDHGYVEIIPTNSTLTPLKLLNRSRILTVPLVIEQYENANLTKFNVTDSEANSTNKNRKDIEQNNFNDTSIVDAIKNDTEEKNIQRRVKRENGGLFKLLSLLEMQQQFTAIESEPLKLSTPLPPTVVPTLTEETFTWSDEYDSFEELGKSSILVRKMLDGANYERK